MSLPHSANWLFNTKWRIRYPTGDWNDSSELFILSRSTYGLMGKIQFAVQTAKASIPSVPDSETQIPSVQNLETQNLAIGLHKQIRPHRRRALTAFKWIFNRCGRRAVLNRGLSIATGPRPEDPEPEDREPKDPEPEDREPEDPEPESPESEGPEPEGGEPEDCEPENEVLPFESAHMHNRTSSSFHNLPMELILATAGYLSPFSRLIMQRVCSKFRAGLAPNGIAPELESNKLTVEEIFQFAFSNAMRN